MLASSQGTLEILEVRDGRLEGVTRGRVRNQLGARQTSWKKVQEGRAFLGGQSGVCTLELIAVHERSVC